MIINSNHIYHVLIIFFIVIIGSIITTNIIHNKNISYNNEDIIGLNHISID